MNTVAEQAEYRCDVCRQTKPFDQIAEIYSDGSCSPFTAMKVTCHECKEEYENACA